MHTVTQKETLMDFSDLANNRWFYAGAGFTTLYWKLYDGSVVDATSGADATFSATSQVQEAQVDIVHYRLFS